MFIGINHMKYLVRFNKKKNILKDIVMVLINKTRAF